MLDTPSPKYAICFASDRNYLDFTLVAIASIIRHASQDFYYDIVILGMECEGREELFSPLQSENVRIRILDMQEYIEKFGMRDFHVSGNIPMAAYFRFFIPQIFEGYDKVLYLDGDILACDDVKHLLREDLGGALVGCVRDIATFKLAPERKRYLEKRLNVSAEQYFCSGVLLYDIVACAAFGLSEKCLAKLKELKDPPYHDQDVLNAVTCGRTKKLPTRWHIITAAFSLSLQEMLRSHPKEAEEYRKALQDPGILHYAGAKPWNEDRLALADLWWKVADTTSVGPSLHVRLERLRGDRLAEAVTLMGRPWLFLTYSFYKVVTLFAGGARRKELKRRAKLLKYIIRHGV